MDDIFVREIPLDYSIGALTAEDEDGNYNVYINARHSLAKKLKSYRHEIEHIQKGHFCDSRPVAEKEAEIKNEPPGGTNGSAKSEIGLV